MKKHILWIAMSLLVLPFTVRAQFNCGFEQKRQELIAKDPLYLQREAQMEQATQQYMQQRSGERSGSYVIPVVFHIIHNNGPENISTAQILDALAILNRDYKKLNADTSVIVHGFDTIAAGMDIEFRLAQIDPQGNCTNGITRRQSSETYIGDDESKLDYWSSNKYLNIWVVASMENGVAGYAYYPSAVDGPGIMATKDGVIILHNYVGSIGTSNPGRSRALTHEVGHYLNLAHPWGNTNNPGVACGDDGVSDTPITKGSTTCNVNLNDCTPGVFENVQNYMDYSYCSVMFTQGQIARMEFALIAGIANRDNLWSAVNLVATGVDGNGPLCAPVADFYPDQQTVCLNTSVQFFDNSTVGIPTSWSWTFQDGSPSVSNSSNPTVSFTSPGWKEVTLTVSNVQGTDSESKTLSIYVSANSADYVTPYWESFEWYLPYQQKWVSNNVDEGTAGFSLLDVAAYTGNYSVMLDYTEPVFGLSDGAGMIDELITPSYNLSAANGTTFNWKWAYATNALNSTDITEKLEVYSSTNCGTTWTLRKTITGVALSSGGSAAGNYFIPSGTSDWGYESILISPSLAQSDVRFKFVFTSSSFSNNLYLEDINIATTTSVEEASDVLLTEIFPNPAAQSITLQLANTGDEKVQVWIVDLLGNEIMQTQFTADALGTTQQQLDVSMLASGVYIVKIQSGNMVRNLRIQKI